MSQIKRTIPFLMAFAMAAAVFANGLGGERLEKIVGDQIVDIGTDQEGTPVAGAPIEFDFNLLDAQSREPLTYVTSVGIDIGHNGKSMVNCDLIPELPTTFLFYTFPEAGNYNLKVTFFDKNRDRQELATAIFPLTISRSAGTTRALYIVALLVTISLGLLGVFWGRRRRGAS